MGPALLLVVIPAVVALSCRASAGRRELTASVGLILSLADKLADYCQSDFVIGDRHVTSEEMGEFYYGLRQARRHAPLSARKPLLSVGRDYTRLLTAYESFVRAADRYRLESKQDPGRLAALMRRHREIKRLGAQVLREIESGDGG